MNPLNTLTIAQLKQAIDIKEKLEILNRELTAVLGSPAAAPAVSATAKTKNGISAAGRARIAAAQKARWAKINAAKAKTPPKPAKQKKFTMSAAAKAAISRAAKARWAKLKASKK